MPPKKSSPPAKQTSEEASQKFMSSLLSRDDDIPRGPTVSWGIVGLPVEPLSREESCMCDPDMRSTRKRELVNSARVTQECKPYLEEGIRDRRRIAELKREIVQIGIQLEKFSIPLKDRHGLVSSKKKEKQEQLFTLQSLYAIERLQKEEELMRLRDRSLEISEEIKSILRKYEDKRRFVHTRIGGTRRRTRSKQKKTNGR
jgi:hypothetical protein